LDDLKDLQRRGEGGQEGEERVDVGAVERDAGEDSERTSEDDECREDGRWS